MNEFWAIIGGTLVINLITGFGTLRAIKTNLHWIEKSINQLDGRVTHLERKGEKS